MNRSKYLVKNTILFALNVIGTKLMTFFLVPLYTNALTTAEYGIVDLIVTVVTVFIPLMTFNIAESTMRFSLDCNANTVQILSISLVFAALSFVSGIIIFFPCYFINSLTKYSKLVYLYCVSESIYQILIYYLRGIEKLGAYAVGNIVRTAMIGCLNIIFLIVLKKGIEGYFLSYIIADTIVILFSVIEGNVLHQIREFNYNKNLAQKMLRYSIVLVPNSFMWWIINSSDRLMVTSILGSSANGIYAIAYKIPNLVSTLSSIFNQAWTYSAIHEQGSNDEEKFNNVMLFNFIDFLLIITSALILLTKPILKVYVSPAYFESWKYTPYLLIGAFYMALGTFYSTSYSVHKDSRGYLYSGTVGAFVNILLNWLLIPVYGITGAALATCSSYIIVLLFRIYDTRKYIKYDLNNTHLKKGSIILFLMLATSFIDNYIGYILMILEAILIAILTRSTIILIWKKIKDKLVKND